MELEKEDVGEVGAKKAMQGALLQKLDTILQAIKPPRRIQTVHFHRKLPLHAEDQAVQRESVRYFFRRDSQFSLHLFQAKKAMQGALLQKLDTILQAKKEFETGRKGEK